MNAVSFLAQVGGLYTISLAIFLYFLLQVRYCWESFIEVLIFLLSLCIRSCFLSCEVYYHLHLLFVEKLSLLSFPFIPIIGCNTWHISSYIFKTFIAHHILPFCFCSWSCVLVISSCFSRSQ